MRASDADILFIPGLDGAGAEHWQSRWSSKLSTGRRVGLGGVDMTDPRALADAMIEASRHSVRPVLLIAQGIGATAVAYAAPRLPHARGAFLVGPTDLEPAPRDPLPFPSLLVAARNDPRVNHAAAEDIAYAWGSAFIDAGDAGALDESSGHGPWPEGLFRLATFLKNL